MRLMVIVKGSPDSEQMPDTKEFTKMLTQMTKYNEDLAKAGVLLAAEGLRPTAAGKRVRFDDDKQTVIDGPFPESKEVIGGFWLIQVNSMDEGIEWVKRAPFGGGAEVEVRQVSEFDDFGDALTPKLREREKRVAQQMIENARR